MRYCLRSKSQYVTNVGPDGRRPVAMAARRHNWVGFSTPPLLFSIFSFWPPISPKHPRTLSAHSRRLYDVRIYALPFGTAHIANCLLAAPLNETTRFAQFDFDNAFDHQSIYREPAAPDSESELG